VIQKLEKALSKLAELSETEQESIAIIILAEIDKKTSLNAWDILEELAGTIEAPLDWSKEHNHYLYGTPKQEVEND
jgi:hypothetical protein